MAPKTKDPALEAIQDLNDSVASSFSLLDADIKRVSDEGERTRSEMREGFKAHSARINVAEREGLRGGPAHSEARGWRNPGRLSREDQNVWEWWRGRLLASTGDERARGLGLEIMERSLPGEIQRVQEFFRRPETAAFASSSDIVPVTLQPLIDHKRSEPAYIEDVGLMIAMPSGTHKLPKEGTAPAAANYAENATIAEDANTVSSTDLVSTKGAKLRHFSIESIQDASADLIQYWMRRIVDSVNELETQQALEGTGTFTGVKTASSVNQVDLANGGALLTNFDLLAEMVTGISASERDPERCAWFVSSAGLRSLLKIKEGGTLRPMLGLDAMPGRLFGFRIIVSDQIATVAGTPDVSTVYFGNWRGLAVGRRGIDMLDVVAEGSGTAFAGGQVSVRVIRRYAVAVHLPNLLVRGINFYIAA